MPLARHPSAYASSPLYACRVTPLRHVVSCLPHQLPTYHAFYPRGQPTGEIFTRFLMASAPVICYRAPLPCRPDLLMEWSRRRHFSLQRSVACRASTIRCTRLPQSALDWQSSTWTIRSLALCSGVAAPSHGLCLVADTRVAVRVRHYV